MSAASPLSPRCPPASSPSSEQAWEVGSVPLSAPAAALMECVERSSHIGVVHLALECDEVGFVLTTRNDNLAVAVPGDAADLFLEQAWQSVRKKVSEAERPSSLSELVQLAPQFTIARALHHFMGCHTQVQPSPLPIMRWSTFPHRTSVVSGRCWQMGLKLVRIFSSGPFLRPTYRLGTLAGW